MRLADFIEANSQAIMGEWETFAASLGPAAESMDRAALRDHAQAMLNAIVADLRTPQTAAQQTEKSMGTADSSPDTADTAAETHGAGRAASGFTLGEMVSEYRALRASILRLWTKANGTLTGADLEDLTRFNESIDQATAESIKRFGDDLDHAKEMFLAVLGHDLRTPIGAIIMSAQFMLDTDELPEPHLTLVTRIVHSARRMNQMTSDLLDFTRIRLGSGIPVVRASMDLAAVARSAADEISAAHPQSVLQLDISGSVTGEWDASRISQLLANLLANAAQHGSAKTTIALNVKGEENDVVIEVHNSGPAIPASALPRLFNPLKRIGSAAHPTDNAGHLGLGLYIAERIVVAHGGTIGVESSEQGGTTFTVRLPR